MSLIWKFNGVDLSTFGNITLIDDYLDMADARGEDATIPFHDGDLFSEKYFGSRELMFSIAPYAASAEDLETLFDTLRALLAPRTQKVLQRIGENGSIRTVNASVNRSISPRRLASNLSKITVVFKLPDPFFRGSDIISASVVVNASPKALNVTNSGAVEERNPLITLTGPLDDVVITNSTNGFTLSYNAAISGGDVVTIQAVDMEYRALLNGVTNVIGNVDHTGGAEFFKVDVGANVLSIVSSVATTGIVAVSFYPPFM